MSAWRLNSRNLEDQPASGLPGATPTWAYDASGNRTTGSCLYDGLNRMTEDASYTYSHDVLGNRTGRTPKPSGTTLTYGWDELNRLLSHGISTYAYRADGMRVAKAVGSTTTLYRYDGQMALRTTRSPARPMS